MTDYVDTQVLPQRAVTAAISGSEVERKQASLALDEATNSARIAGLDRTIGRLVDTQVSHERRLAGTDHQIELIERDLRRIERRMSRYALIVFAMVLVLAWVM